MPGAFQSFFPLGSLRELETRGGSLFLSALQSRDQKVNLITNQKKMTVLFQNQVSHYHPVQESVRSASMQGWLHTEAMHVKSFTGNIATPFGEFLCQH